MENNDLTNAQVETETRFHISFFHCVFNGINLFLSFHIFPYCPRGRSNPHGTSGAASLLCSFLEFFCYVCSTSSNSFSSLLRIVFDEVHLLASLFSSREIALMKLLHHPNVCELIDVEFNDDKGYLYCVYSTHTYNVFQLILHYYTGLRSNLMKFCESI